VCNFTRGHKLNVAAAAKRNLSCAAQKRLSGLTGSFHAERLRVGWSTTYTA